MAFEAERNQRIRELQAYAEQKVQEAARMSDAEKSQRLRESQAPAKEKMQEAAWMREEQERRRHGPLGQPVVDNDGTYL